MKSTSTILLICLTAALGFGCGEKPDNDEEAGTTASGGTVAEGGATEDATDGGTDGVVDRGAGGATDGVREDARGLETNTARSSIPVNCTLDEVSNIRAMSRSRGGVTQSVSFEIDPAGFFLSINGENCDPNVSFTNADQCRGTASCGGQQFDYFPEQSLGGGLVWVLMDGATRWELGTFTGTLSVTAGTSGTSEGTAGGTGGAGNNGGTTAGVCGATDDARGWTSLVAGTYLWHSRALNTDSAVMLRSDCGYCAASSLDADDDIGGVYNLAIDGTWEVLDHVVEADGESYTRVRVGSSIYRVWEVHIQQALDFDQIWNVTTIPWTLQDAQGGEFGPVSLGIPRLVKLDSGYSTAGDPAFPRNSSNGESMTGYRCSAGGNL